MKLRGSRLVYSPAGIAASARPLHATISEIVRGGGGNGFVGAACDLLRRCVDGHHLIVVGYSGSDDLDVMPTLTGTAPASVTWISHGEDRPREVIIDRQPASVVWTLLSGWQSLPGTTARWIIGDTEDALRELGFDVPASLSKSKLKAIRAAQRAYLDRWAMAAHRDDPTGLGWVALILGELVQHDRAYQALLDATPARTGGALWSPQRRFYELAQNVFLRTPEDLAAVRGWAERARAEAVVRADRAGAAAADIIIARSLLYRDELNDAEAQLHSAQAELDSEPPPPVPSPTQTAITHCFARLSLQRRDGGQATALALRAAQQRNALGHWAEESESLQIAAQGCWMDEDYPRARTMLDRAIHIARMGPYLDQLQAALTRLGFMTFDAGDTEVGDRRRRPRGPVPMGSSRPLLLSWRRPRHPPSAPDCRPGRGRSQRPVVRRGRRPTVPPSGDRRGTPPRKHRARWRLARRRATPRAIPPG